MSIRPTMPPKESSALNPVHILRHTWAPDLAAGCAVLLLGALETARGPGLTAVPQMLLVACVATVVGLVRQAPGAALALAWPAALAQVLSGTPLLLVQTAEVIVAFGCARWGSRLMLWLSGLSIPAATVLVLLHLYTGGALWATPRLTWLGPLLGSTGSSWLYVVGVCVVSLLALPWLTGLAVRLSHGAQAARRSQAAAEAETARAHAERAQAEEIARLREGQARLARDVHDVVGHSLAVILAQAESAQFLPRDEAGSPALHKIMRTIATSARCSLQDVRQVLTSAAEDAEREASDRDGPHGPHEPHGPDRLEQMLAGVRASGHQVVHAEHGTEQPLAPEAEEAAFRVLQEMLTNAVKHGSRDAPIRLTRHWPDCGSDGGSDGEGAPGTRELRIEVRNRAARAPASPGSPASPDTAGGTGALSGRLGLEGMRSRLAAVEGQLEVRDSGAPGTDFCATARIPVRAVAR